MFCRQILSAAFSLRPLSWPINDSDLGQIQGCPARPVSVAISNFARQFFARKLLSTTNEIVLSTTKQNRFREDPRQADLSRKNGAVKRKFSERKFDFEIQNFGLQF